MKKHIPNILTASRILVFAPLLVWLTLTQQWTLAVVCLSFGLLTNALDGYLARRWNVVSKLGGDILQPICDFVFAVTAVVMLIVTGRWSFWVGVVAFAIAAVLQLISFLAGALPDNQTIQMLKRHQTYIHPFYSATVMLVAWFAYVVIEDALDVSVPFNVWLFLAYTMTFIAFAFNYSYVKQFVKRSLVRA